MRYIEMEDRLFAELSKRFWARVSDEPDEADEFLHIEEIIATSNALYFVGDYFSRQVRRWI
jgi:hypothetical protein